MSYSPDFGAGMARARNRGPMPPFLEAILFVICGLIIGAGGTVYVMNDSVRDFLTRPDQLPGHLLNRMDSNLGLTAAQHEAARHIIEKHFAALDDVRRRFQPEIQTTLDAMRDEIATILEPDQQTIWLQNFERVRSDWQPGPLVPTGGTQNVSSDPDAGASPGA